MTDVWRVVVDREACIGTGVCVSCAPRHFHLVGGKSAAVEETVTPTDEVAAAQESCPMEAIHVSSAAASAAK